MQISHMLREAVSDAWQIAEGCKFRQRERRFGNERVGASIVAHV